MSRSTSTPVGFLAKAIGTLVSADAFSIIAAAAFSIVLARTLGKDALGLYALAFALLAILQTLINCGYELSLPRTISVKPHQLGALLREAQRMKLSLLLLAIAPTATLIAVFGPDNDAYLLAFPILWLAPRSFTATYAAAFRGLLHVKPIAVVESIVTGIAHAIAIVCVFAAPSLLTVFVIFSIGECAKALWLHKRLRVHASQRLGVELPHMFALRRSAASQSIAESWPRFWKNKNVLAFAATLKRQMPVSATQILSALSSRSAILLIEALSTTSAVGVFSAANRFLSALRVAPGALLNVLIPEFSKRSAAKRLDGIRNAALIVLPIGVAVSALLHTFAEPLIVFTFGPVFRESAVVLQTLGWTFCLVMINHVLEAFLLALRREKAVNIALTLQILLILALNVTLLPHYGVIAVAWAALVAEAGALAILGTTCVIAIRRP